MDDNTKKLKFIYDFCKNHRTSWCHSMGCCPLRRRCIIKKASMYNDPAFVIDSVSKIQRCLNKERKLNEVNPFAKFEGETSAD